MYIDADEALADGLFCESGAIFHELYNISIVNISNWTEWNTIQGVLINGSLQVISKSDKRMRGQFEITSTITP